MLWHVVSDRFNIHYIPYVYKVKIEKIKKHMIKYIGCIRNKTILFRLTGITKMNKLKKINSLR